ncbi:hypothetical protein ACFSO0_05485 [Brevibacillus sp. GCM10020057]|uniref:hypothetical protein n=1 Tax=Brevibacillus sp. GCM10020057 TaxID=3317327 RepID=UPI003633A9B3
MVTGFLIYSADPNYVKDFVSKSVDVTLVATGGSSDNITLYKQVSDKSASVKVALTDLTDAATYTVDLPAGLVNDLNGNASEEKTGVSVTRGSDAVSDKPELTTADTNGIKQIDSNTVEVYFKSKVDGASATNKANYSIEGSTIEKAELTANAVGGATVKLTLAKDSSTFTGVKTVTVSGVKSETGVTMDPVTTTENLLENVRPTVISATLTDSDTITLTFSEVVKADSVKEGTAVADFEIYVGNVKYATAFTEDTDTTADSNKVVLTLTGGATFQPSDLANLTVKAASGFDVKDDAGNVANFKSVTVE